MKRKIDLGLVVWTVVSVVFWGWYSAVTGTLHPYLVYFPLWIGIFGVLVWRRRERLAVSLQAWDAPSVVKFLVLGFGAVLTEEVLAALATHLPQGFSPLVFVARIVQFQALNLFTFFGFVVGWWGLNRYFAFSRREVFYLAGAWGLYAEKVVFVIPSNPLYFLFSFAPLVLTYGLIITPALLSQRDRPRRRQLHPVLRYPLAYAVIFALSLPAILLLRLVRAALPLAFPPESLVPL